MGQDFPKYFLQFVTNPPLATLYRSRHLDLKEIGEYSEHTAKVSIRE
jgi:hypothetical protein